MRNVTVPLALVVCLLTSAPASSQTRSVSRAGDVRAPEGGQVSPADRT